MFKAVVLVFCLISLTFAISPIERVKEIVAKDECGFNAMENIRPRLEKKIELLKAVLPIIFLESQQLESKN
jgi:hypothetical protein